MKKKHEKKEDLTGTNDKINEKIMIRIIIQWWKEDYKLCIMKIWMISINKMNDRN